MDPGCFLLGFATAFAITTVVILVAYYYLKHTRWKNSNIKGYLDLIPDLTHEQRLQVQSIRQTFLPKVDKIRQDLCQLRISMAKALFSEPTDRDKVHSIGQEILRCQSDLELEVIEHILEEKELLKVEQQIKFYEIIIQQFARGGLGVHDVEQRK